MQGKSVGWLLYVRDLCHETVNKKPINKSSWIFTLFKMCTKANKNSKQHHLLKINNSHCFKSIKSPGTSF